MISSLYIMADAGAPSFCYYPSPSSKTATDVLSPDLLDRALDFLADNQLAFTLLLGNRPLESGVETLLDGIPHGRVQPASVSGRRPEDVAVLDLGDSSDDFESDAGASGILALRVERKKIPLLAEAIQSLSTSFRRINIHLLDLGEYTDKDIAAYRDVLSTLSGWLTDEFRKGNAFELNILSDRMLLQEMNNCGAGTNHLTLAPNGKFYICPGFFHDSPSDSVGNLDDGISIPNKQLFELNFSPVCRICDAYQCKRCIYLNRKTTLEVNIPSYQQCTVSHLERDESRRMLENLRDIYELSRLPGIPELDYMDPLMVLRDRSKAPRKPEALSPPGDGTKEALPPLGELRPKAWGPSLSGASGTGMGSLLSQDFTGVLGEILAVQKEILTLLKKGR